MTCPNGLDRSRVGVTAGRGVGGAVVRNRAKRLLREAVRRHVGHTRSGWDIVLIARPALISAPWPSLTEAIDQLMLQSGCLAHANDDNA
jgi:ribonuclease P protein component